MGGRGKVGGESLERSCVAGGGFGVGGVQFLGES